MRIRDSRDISHHVGDTARNPFLALSDDACAQRNLHDGKLYRAGDQRTAAEHSASLFRGKCGMRRRGILFTEDGLHEQCDLLFFRPVLVAGFVEANI